MGRGHQRPLVVRVDERVGVVGVDELPVRLVGHQVNLGAVSTFGLTNYLSQRSDALCRVYDPGRVVGRVDDHRSRAGRDRRGKGFGVGLEVLVAVGDFSLTALVRDVKDVLGKVGGEEHNLVVLVQYRPQDHVQRAGRRPRSSSRLRR